MTYIRRYEPTTLINEVNKIIEQAFRPMSNSDPSNIETSQWTPAVDLKEEKNQFIILADLPGVDKEKIDIAMEDHILTIKGSRSDITEGEASMSLRCERVKGTFYRRFTLPDTADWEKIQAKMQKGVLEISIPKKETAKPKFVKIECAE